MPIRNSDFKNMAGLYIHIPFCESRCIYCGFYSTTSLSMRDDYVDALCKEMKMRPFKTATDYDYSLRTIYLGVELPACLTTISSSAFSKVSRRLIFLQIIRKKNSQKWKLRWNATPMMSQKNSARLSCSCP